MFGLSTGELVVIFLIILLLFGGANLPKLTRSLGKSVKEFKNALKEDDTSPGQDSSSKDAPPPPEKS
ncbi:MAG: twin-arginine translocase TatA/TatE family subunit [Deltaproteobacteria bacterium]|nr:twin-arginine translocase TatA/TatE family subunit [Deltaproteobacteria bacterium]